MVKLHEEMKLAGYFLFFSTLHVYEVDFGGPAWGQGERRHVLFLSNLPLRMLHLDGVGRLLGTIVQQIHGKRTIAIYFILLIQFLITSTFS